MMSRILKILTSLFWWIVLHVLIVVNFVRFGFILMFGDLSVKVVPPATVVQALGNNPGEGQMDNVAPKDSDIATALLPSAVEGDLEDLDREIKSLQESLEGFTGTTNRPTPAVIRLGKLFLERHEQKWDDHDLNSAIDLLGEALLLLTADEPDRIVVLNNLGRALITRYEMLGRISDVEKAIVHHREALSLLSGNHLDRPSTLSDLADALVARYGRSGGISDVEEAIIHLREAVSLVSGDHPARLPSLSSLAIALTIRYKRLGRISDVEEAIIHFRDAITLLSGNHLHRPSTLSNLANALTIRYKTLGRISDVEEAIGHFREAIALLSANHPNRPASLNNLANALNIRYQKLGRISDIEEAIVHGREAVSLLSANHPERPKSLTNLGTALFARYERLGRISDLEEAIIHHRKAVSLWLSNHPERPVGLNNLARALDARYSMLGNISDLEEAIVQWRDALSLRSGNHPARSVSLNNLAGALITRYKRLGRTSDVEEAIVHHREVLSLRPGNHPNRPSSLNNLAFALDARYRMLRNISDQEEAIGLLEEACNISDPDDPQRSAYIHNLANRLLDRRGKGDLDKAIDLYEGVLSLQHNDHPSRPATLYQLGKALLLRGQDASDVETGMSYIDEAFSLFPSNSPNRQLALLVFLEDFSERTDKTVLRDRCIQLAKLTSPENARYSNMASLVAPILYDCHETASELLTALGIDPGLNAEDATLTLLRKGSQCTTSLSRDQLETTCDWITYSERFNRPRNLEMYGLILEHLDHAVARGPSLDIRRRRLSDDGVFQRARDLVSDAVAFAIEQEAVETAVEFLERGRSILLAQLSMYRVSSGLEAVAPDLAARLKSLGWEVESATFTGGKGLMDMGAKPPFEDPISRAGRLRREWEQVVEEIRALDGFQQFLRPTPFAHLQEAAAKGPVIFINISKLRSDAVIVFSHRPPITVPLPEVTPDSAKSLAESFKVGNDPYGPLRGLWEEVVEPVISTLEAMGDVVPKSKRIWWCPAGPLTALPIHAAGNYIERTGRRLPGLYVSSYTPTLSALCRARQGRSGRSGMPSFLVVGQSHTPGLSPLPAVPDEVARVKKRMPHATVVEDEHGTRERVLSLMTQHQWVHLSCHGKVRSKNPLQSHFALHDGPLSVVELMQNRLPLAELAFLSCCHSASGDSTTPDEFLHLAAAMQFTGFKSVVATLWAMDDAVGPDLADEFYRRLLKQRKGDYRQSAKVLNDALKVLRLGGVPLRVWINFVHWGA